MPPVAGGIEQMGHASIQITVDIYGHLVPGGNRAAVDRLDSTSQHDYEGTVAVRRVAGGGRYRPSS